MPDTISDLGQLDAVMAEPYPEVVAMLGRIRGDILVLGAGGKMGPSLVRLALNACRLAGVAKRVIAVSRFSDQGQLRQLLDLGAEAIPGDLLDHDLIERLPDAENVLFLAGRKFGAAGSEAATWATNAALPAAVARRFHRSRIVAFSTGCVYPLLPPTAAGCTEDDPPAPVGEYAWSCLGRERAFEYWSRRDGTPVLLFRLNYAVDLRYGVLLDLARTLARGDAVDRRVGAVNLIWQGDANNRALLCLEHAAAPPAILNVTGPERIAVDELALRLGRAMHRAVRFRGTDSGKAYLSDASRSIALFGPPRVPLDRMIRWVAHWVEIDGPTLNKPTQFQVTDGDFLDGPTPTTGTPSP